MRIQLRLLLVTALVAGVFTQLPGPGAALSRAAFAATAGGDAVIVWNAHAGVAATKACIAPLDDPFHESRMYAMMHIAIHDALNAIDRRFQPYAFDKRVEPGASPEAAVAAAARDVLVPLLGQLPRELPFITQSCIDAGVASVEAAYTAALAALPDAPAKAQGIAVGQAAAAAILARRAADGAVGPFLNSNCPQDTSPGKYQCTPGFPFVAFEVWGKVTPFVLQDSAQFRPGPPYAVTDKAYTADFNEVKSLGGDGSTTPSARTADQTRNRLLLVGKLSAEVEPHCASRLRQQRVQPLAERAALRLCSIWRWRMATSRCPRPKTITAIGDRSPPFGPGRRTAIRTRPVTRPGRRCAQPRRTRTMPPVTRSKEEPVPKCLSRYLAPTGSASRTVA